MKIIKPSLLLFTFIKPKGFELKHFCLSQPEYTQVDTHTTPPSHTHSHVALLKLYVKLPTLTPYITINLFKQLEDEQIGITPEH